MLGYLKRGRGLPPAAASSMAARCRRPAVDRPRMPRSAICAAPPTRSAGAAAARAARGRQLRAAALRPRGGALPGLRRARRPLAAGALQAGARALPAPASPARRSSRCRRRSRIDDQFAEALLPARALLPRRAAAATSALRALEPSVRLGAGACFTRAKSWPISTGALGRTDERLAQLEALRGARSGAVARGRARPRVRARRPVRSRGHDARARRGAVSRSLLHLRRARPGVARDGAGARRSRRLEQGARRARRSGRQRRQQRSADAVRPRAAAAAGRGGGGADAAAGDARSCRSIRWPSTTSPTPPSGAATTTSARRALLDYHALEGGRRRRRAAAPRSPIRLGDLSLQAATTRPRPSPGTSARADASRRRCCRCSRASPTRSCRPATRTPRAPRSTRRSKRIRINRAMRLRRALRDARDSGIGR